MATVIMHGNAEHIGDYPPEFLQHFRTVGQILTKAQLRDLTNFARHLGSFIELCRE